MLEKNRYYNLSDFCRVLKESQEFKAKMGKNVEKENKKNKKEVDDILKQTEQYNSKAKDSKLSKEPKDVETEFTRNDMLHLRYRFNPNEKHKKDVIAQGEGFASDLNKKNSKIKEENKGLDFEGNKEYVEKSKKDVEKLKKIIDDEVSSGLKTSKNKSKQEQIKQTLNNSIFENKKMKRLHFNKTVFLNEEQMKKKIPDVMKVNGNKFYMKDSVGNEYLVECVQDKVLKDVIHTNVIDYKNTRKIFESFNRMKQLYEYKSSGNKQNSGEYENEMVSKMINETKDLLAIK